MSFFDLRLLITLHTFLANYKCILSVRPSGNVKLTFVLVNILTVNIIILIVCI